MAVSIISGNGTDTASVDPLSKAVRVTLYSSDGHEGSHDSPELIPSNSVALVNEDLLSSVDVSLYKHISIQISGTWSGEVEFQGSNDNANFFPVVAQDISTLVDPYSTSVTENSLLKIPILFKFLRVRLVNYISGQVNSLVYGYSEGNPFSSVSQIGSVNLNAETTKVIGTVNIAPFSNSISGAITSSDTTVPAPVGDGVLLTGNPSADSFVKLQSDSRDSAWTIEITGTMGGGILYFEGSSSSSDGIDGYWVSLNAIQAGVTPATVLYSTDTVGEFRGNAAGIKFIRVRAIGGTGLNVNVTMRLAAGTGSIFLSTAIPTGDNIIGKVEIEGSVPTGGNIIGKVEIEGSIPTGGNTIGKVEIDTGDGVPIYQKFIAGTGLNATVVSNVPTKMTILHIVNGAATLRFFKIYDKATTPNVGTDVPLITITLPSGASNFTLPALVGIDFVNGLSFALTLGATDGDTTPSTVASEVTAMIAHIVA